MSESILPLTTIRPDKGQIKGTAESEMELCCHPTYVKVNSLTVESDECGVDTIFDANKPFRVNSEIEFYGPGALALMALNVPIQVTYTAESYGPGIEAVIAEVRFNTSAGRLVYTAEATVAAGTLDGDKLYRISMLFRMGAEGTRLSIANGFISGILVQAYQ
ncbi:MAG: hypothetical protein K6T90_11620 [Leptolyngbyaceae cyanobacterium HOT.MB2.61]|nr:hypothetical protein [Leptolyngbyaceae cyanobacterium HOT.MB2.61]